jgi:hypothetical protein
MMMTASKLLTSLLLFFAATTANAFTVGRLAQRPSTTKLFLEDWVANMIDGELYRQSHLNEFENEWMEKNRAAVFSKMESDFMYEPDKTEYVMHRRDEKMAKDNPQKYCADRCVATGNCDIYED